MADLVVDTDVVSFGFRQDTRYVSFYGPAIQSHRAVISFMTVAEMRYGALNRNWGQKKTESLHRYLSQRYVQYGVTDEMCLRWAALIHDSKQQGRVLKPADAWIAGTALELDLPLVTNNARDFQHLPHLQLITYGEQ